MYRLTKSGRDLRKRYESVLEDSLGGEKGIPLYLPTLGILWGGEDTGEQPEGLEERGYFDALLGWGYIEEVEE